MEFEAVGVQYYEKALISVAHKGGYFDKPDNQFVKIYPDGKRIFKYYFNDCEARLVPEPKNRHDKNAVMITLDGKCVGYVPANLCAQVKRLMKGFYDLTVQVRGGPSKAAHDGKVYRDKQGYHIYVTIAPKSSKKPKSPAKAKREGGNIGGFFTKLLSAFNHKTE